MTCQPRFTGLPRLARGAVLGAAAVLITMLGHAGGQGALPEAGLLLLLIPLALPLGMLAADRRRSAAWILGFVLALQVLFHLVLTIAAGHGHHGSLLPTTSMLLGHLVAALAVTAAITHGDALVHRWIAFWQALTLARDWTLIPVARVSQPILRDPSRTYTAELAHCIARRGPPVS